MDSPNSSIIPVCPGQPPAPETAVSEPKSAASIKPAPHRSLARKRSRKPVRKTLRVAGERVTDAAPPAVPAGAGGQDVHEEGLRLAGQQLLELLKSQSLESLKEPFNEAELYAKLIGLIARVSDGGLKYEKFRFDQAERIQRVQKKLEDCKKRGGLSRESLEIIERELRLF